MPEGHKKLYIGIGAGVGVLALAGVGLRLRAVSKAKAAGTPISFVPKVLSSAAAATATVPGPVSPAVSSNLSAASAQGVSAGDIVAAQILAGQVDATTGAPTSTAGQSAVVTTNDPVPSGDLIIRDAPDQSANQIGGAEKNGTVTVLDDTDAVFAKIAWLGGNRLPPAVGFVHKQFLKLV